LSDHPAPEVEREDRGSKRRYVIRRPEGEAELTLSVLSPERVIADHTLVPDSLRGQGLAQALLQALLDDARSQGFRIVPLCPFVASQARRHPEWDDLFAR
jgi:hypothetical protein